MSFKSHRDRLIIEFERMGVAMKTRFKSHRDRLIIKWKVDRLLYRLVSNPIGIG